MKKKNKKKRIKEIEKVYKTLGLRSKELCRYFITLGNIPSYDNQEKKDITFIETDSGSVKLEEITNARLE